MAFCPDVPSAITETNDNAGAEFSTTWQPKKCSF